MSQIAIPKPMPTMRPLVIAIVLTVATVRSIECVVFADCGGVSGKVTAISVFGCPTTSAACSFKSGTNATIDVHFESGLI